MMKKVTQKYIVMMVLCLVYSFLFNNAIAYAKETEIPGVEQEAALLVAEQQEMLPDVNQVEILFEIVDEEHCRQSVRLYFSNDSTAAQKSALSDFMAKKLEEINVAGLSMGQNTLPEYTCYDFNRGIVPLDGCDRFLNEIFGKDAATLHVENKTEELAPFIFGNQMILDLNLPEWLHTKERDGVKVYFGVMRPEAIKCFVNDSYLDQKDRRFFPASKDESGWYDVVFTAEHTGNTIHFPLWVLNENLVKAIDVELVREGENWRRTSTFSFDRKPDENAAERIEKYFQDRAETANKEARETIVSVVGEWNEGDFTLVITQTGDAQTLQESSKLLFGGEDVLKYERESNIWKVKKTECYGNKIDYSGILNYVPTGFRINLTIPVNKDEVCDFCNYDSVMLADGLLQVSTLEKQIDLDYEGTMTDQAAVARWGVSAAVGLVVVGMISAVILRSLRRRKGTGEKQVFFCPSCGTLLKADSTVCKKCGKKITH